MIEKLKVSHDELIKDQIDSIVKVCLKIQELINKVNALEKAVKQCDRPIDLEV